jgi:hypothetical protein
MIMPFIRNIELRKMQSKIDQLKCALKWTLPLAKDWRGSIIGHPNMKVVADFDKHIKQAKQALKNAS